VNKNDQVTSAGHNEEEMERVEEKMQCVEEKNAVGKKLLTEHEKIEKNEFEVSFFNIRYLLFYLFLLL